jgi:hypothetical protein
MSQVARRRASPGARLLPVWVAAALLVHAAVLHFGGGAFTVFIRSDRSGPMLVRSIPLQPIPDYVSALVGQPSMQTGDRPGRTDSVAGAAQAASSVAGVSAEESPRGYDVPPIPEQGWKVSFQAIDPSANSDTVAVVELEVSAQGLVRRWRVVESNATMEATESLLLGIEATPMWPAVRDGEPVDAIVRYELRFLRVPSN